MDNRREFLKKAGLISGGTTLLNVLPASIAKALAINPAAGSSFYDAEHIVFLMQENRSFDHAYGTLQGVRGFNDPRAIDLPDRNPVWLQTNKAGETYAPFRFDIKDTKVTWMSSLPHSWSDQVDARNDGRYDKWLDAKASGHKEYKEMPLTMGYYSREDIPFYYSLADAFTVCDQNFCSALTGTTPNRLYFWSGTIREKPEAASLANVWNDDADYDTMVSWKTFPERLEENSVSWKVYQNELSVGVGFTDEEDGWLSNFTDNALEFFTQYQVKLSKEYINNLPKAAASMSEELSALEKQISAAAPTSADYQKMLARKERLKKMLQENEADQKNFTIEKYNQLSAFQKNIHDKAFSTNRGDPDYHQLTTMEYEDGGVKRQLRIPKGDILHEFRSDVTNKKLPMVSWLVPPANLSDHPGSAWYGAWYISEVMDILTQDPEIWKKTIFILTYDENDGYYDHVPPFVPPHPFQKDTGKVSPGIDTAVEYVTDNKQQSNQRRARLSPVGLGYRVPLVIASPWTRGGWVNSQVFDHTSSLQFLEKFLSRKLNRKIEEPNISQWRRTVCGDLSSVFRAYEGEPVSPPAFPGKEAFIESIHKAQFKNPPANFRKLTPSETEDIRKQPARTTLLPQQEKGVRPSNALPYELYVSGKVTADRKKFELLFAAGDNVFGKQAAGSPFQVYAPGRYRNELVSVRNYAVLPGDAVRDDWAIADFENSQYHLRAYGPNGFYREFRGDANDLNISLSCLYEKAKTASALTGNLLIKIKNETALPVTIRLEDNAYGQPTKTVVIAASKETAITVDLSKSHGWYDINLSLPVNAKYQRRFAGRVETGRSSKTDPFMGRV
jgi:phospholipase C